MVGLLELNSSPANVSNLLCNAPANAIWINAGDSPLKVQIGLSSISTSMTLNPGMAIALGARIVVTLSAAPRNLDELFQVPQNPPRFSGLCLTTGVKTRRSWLNALGSEVEPSTSQNQPVATELLLDPAKSHTVEEIPSINIPSQNRNHGHSIRDRLEQLGVTLKTKAFIRVAPTKNSSLLPNFLESKVNLIVKWTTNIKELNPDITLPEIKRVLPAWETPRGGDRFRIIKIFFKSKTGLVAMKDLMHGSKLDLVDGLPTELERFRDKIYVTLPNFREKPLIHGC